MDPADAAELISEIKEERAEAEAGEKFRNRAALTIAIMAMLLAVGSLGGGNATDDMVYGNIKASDTWAFYQAKNVRQTEYRLAADRLELELADPSLNATARTAAQAQLARYRETIARYDNEPDPKAPGDSLRGEGKQQLATQARSYEAVRNRASDRDGNFDYSEVFLQLAIVLGSVAILAGSRAVLTMSWVLGAIGAVLMVNGFLLLFPLPF
ncbi:MAG TPA: DUF4337 domain-containing protein [Longimicrobium sp.]|jgi:hypothetical protein|nr:DUF4337 domain-containing protein [Longimicrobium sp.]